MMLAGYRPLYWASLTVTEDDSDVINIVYKSEGYRPLYWASLT